MMNPLPSVNKAYTMLTSDERQCMTAETRINRDVSEFMSLYAGKGGYNSAEDRFDLYDEKGQGIYNPTWSVSHDCGKSGYHNNVGYNNHIAGGSRYTTKQKKI